MERLLKGASLALAFSLTLGGVASATPSKDELKTEAAFGKAGAKFTDAKSKCVSKCITTAVKLSLPQSDCLAPAFINPAVSICIFDAVKGAEAKAAAAMIKAGLKDCPECYAGGCAVEAANRVAALESQIDPFGALVFCDPAPDPKTTLKCELTVAKTLGKFVAARQKCYDKCEANAFAGKIPDDEACLPPATDPATVACLSAPLKGTEAKAALAIDKGCALKAANPACYVPTFATGAAWVSLVAVAVDGNISVTYCESASGAFID